MTDNDDNVDTLGENNKLLDSEKDSKDSVNKKSSMPELFERWDGNYFPPQFKKKILEHRFNYCYTLPQARRRIKFSILLLIFESAAFFGWFLYYYLSPEDYSDFGTQLASNSSNSEVSSNDTMDDSNSLIPAVSNLTDPLIFSNASNPLQNTLDSFDSLEETPLQFNFIGTLIAGFSFAFFTVSFLLIRHTRKLKYQPTNVHFNDNYNLKPTTENGLENQKSNQTSVKMTKKMCVLHGDTCLCKLELTDAQISLNKNEQEKTVKYFKTLVNAVFIFIMLLTFGILASNCFYLPQAFILQLQLFIYICMPFHIKHATFFGVTCSLMAIAITISSPLTVIGTVKPTTIFETNLQKTFKNPKSFYSTPQFLIQNILAHLVLHIVLIYLKFFWTVSYRNMFIRKGHAVLSYMEMNVELDKQTSLIHSCMPKYVADQIETDITGDEENKLKQKSMNEDDHAQFRNFMFLQTKDNVSVLFADIVGFTNMSSKRTAAELVDALNDLFQRFDELCEKTGCEKIATLGDCYYACAGCPEDCDDHADRTVELGLLIIKSIREFCQERGDTVDMRIGIHSGKVMYGIVGLKKFKFDIFSDGVTLANAMETTGIKGSVHISRETKDALMPVMLDGKVIRQSKYNITPGDDEHANRDEKSQALYKEITTIHQDVNGFQNKGRTKETFFIKPEEQTNYSESIYRAFLENI